MKWHFLTLITILFVKIAIHRDYKFTGWTNSLNNLTETRIKNEL